MPVNDGKRVFPVLSTSRGHEMKVHSHLMDNENGAIKNPAQLVPSVLPLARTFRELFYGWFFVEQSARQQQQELPQAISFHKIIYLLVR